MNLAEMRTRVRRDLHDEDAANYRWTDDELARHIDHSLREFSQACPREQKATVATTSGSREMDISSLTDRVVIKAVEYPVGKFPPIYQRFSLWQDTVTLLGDEVPDGSNCYVYYGKLHTLDATTSTIPSQHEDVVAIGAEAYAAIEWSSYATDRISVGGDDVDRQYSYWGRDRLGQFKKELKRLKSRLRTSSLYKPYYPPDSKTTDWGP
jgi:hypothetical protein